MKRNPSPHLMLYLRKEDRPIVDRARKLFRFYADCSLSDIMLRECKKIVDKYDGSGDGK